MKVVTIFSWLNFGRPAPPGRGSAAGRKFLALPYYSQRAVFASPLSALFISFCLTTHKHTLGCAVLPRIREGTHRSSRKTFGFAEVTSNYSCLFYVIMWCSLFSQSLSLVCLYSAVLFVSYCSFFSACIAKKHVI